MWVFSLPWETSALVCEPSLVFLVTHKGVFWPWGAFL